MFIDADKPGYASYFVEVADRVTPGGLLLADNVLRGGRITDGESEIISGLRRFNDLVAGDDRFETVLLPVFDGLTFARKLP